MLFNVFCFARTSFAPKGAKDARCKVLNNPDFPPSIMADLFLARVLPKYMVPDMRVMAIADINPLQLYLEKGIRALGFDADQTLCEYHGEKNLPDILETLEGFRSVYDGMMFIISNCATQRKEELEWMFSMPVMRSTEKKPSLGPYREAEKFFGLPPSAMAYVDDRLLTGIAGANRAGWYSIKVEPLFPGKEPANIRMPRALEDALFKLYYGSNLASPI